MHLIQTTTRALLATALLATAVTSQTWNLRNDWSNLQNPNGPWIYRAGPIVLPAQPVHEPSCWSSPQFAWARSAGGNDRMPALYRQGSTAFTCGPVDLQVGDIATHTNDPYGGIGPYPSVFAWRSPVTAFVTISGAIWPAGRTRAGSEIRCRCRSAPSA